MSKLSKRQLQAALDALVAANNAAAVARNKIAEHCLEVYGCEPADVDFDEFIDGADGGCGMSGGMTVEAFNKGMREAVDGKGK